MTGKVGSTPDNPIKLTKYRVTIWPRHGATENIFLEAPDVFTAHKYAHRVYPEHTILAIKNVLDL